MNILLVIVALLSLGVAALLAVQNRHLAGEHERRAAARAEALRAAAAEPPGPAPAPVASSHELFATADAAAPDAAALGRRALPVAAVAIVLLAGLALWSSRPGEGVTGGAAGAPLELVALHHERSAGGLSISGIVRNPARGRTITAASVVVTAFDRTGAVVGSVADPLDFQTLAPGDESPFVVRLSDAGTIGRYRVGFRAGTRSLLHVDRRATGSSPAVRGADLQVRREAR